MNERIKELSLQCGAWHQVYDHKSLMVDRHFDIEKFGQLIVRECAEVGSKFSQAHPEDISYQIKKHFGVKE